MTQKDIKIKNQIITSKEPRLAGEIISALKYLHNTQKKIANGEFVTAKLLSFLKTWKGLDTTKDIQNLDIGKI